MSAHTKPPRHWKRKGARVLRLVGRLTLAGGMALAAHQGTKHWLEANRGTMHLPEKVFSDTREMVGKSADLLVDPYSHDSFSRESLDLLERTNSGGETFLNIAKGRFEFTDTKTGRMRYVPLKPYFRSIKELEHLLPIPKDWLFVYNLTVEEVDRRVQDFNNNPYLDGGALYRKIKTRYFGEDKQPMSEYNAVHDYFAGQVESEALRNSAEFYARLTPVQKIRVDSFLDKFPKNVLERVVQEVDKLNRQLDKKIRTYPTRAAAIGFLMGLSLLYVASRKKR